MIKKLVKTGEFTKLIKNKEIARQGKKKTAIRGGCEIKKTR
jgi:hypothetical protein